MAHAINKEFQTLVTLATLGTALSGLVDADFPAGVVTLRQISPTGASPAAVALTGGVEFSVEEVYAGAGQYALKFDSSVASSEGLWSIKVVGGPMAIDLLIGALLFVKHDIEDELAWLAGKNTVGKATGHDAEGNAVQFFIYGFDSPADADLWAADSVGNASLVRWVSQKDRAFRAEDGFLDMYVSKVI